MHISSSYVKILGGNYFAHGRFAEVGQKQKTERKKEEERRERERRLLITMAKLRKAHFQSLHFHLLGQNRSLLNLHTTKKRGGLGSPLWLFTACIPQCFSPHSFLKKCSFEKSNHNFSKRVFVCKT